MHSDFTIFYFHQHFTRVPISLNTDNTFCYFFINYNHLSRCKQGSQIGFDFHFPNNEWYFAFLCVLKPFVYLLWKSMCSSLVLIFLNWVVFMLLSCSVLYIPNIKPIQICNVQMFTYVQLPNMSFLFSC